MMNYERLEPFSLATLPIELRQILFAPSHGFNYKTYLIKLKKNMV